jgi:hypothetical protein
MEHFMTNNLFIRRSYLLILKESIISFTKYTFFIKNDNGLGNFASHLDRIIKYYIFINKMYHL